MRYQFEICANSVDSAWNGMRAGAHRIELCDGIPEGGTTPSYGKIALAREVLTAAKLHVIIRPRSGDFLYSECELLIMEKDIEIARQLKADGVVFGCLTPEGEIDVVTMKRLMKKAKGLSVTFHRAFDVCKNPQKALRQLIKLGCQRVLTSGQKKTAEDGIELLAELQKRAAGRISLIAGCGVNENNIARIAAETGIMEFHFSAREPQDSRMLYRNEQVSMGGTVTINEFEYPMTTERRVRAIIEAIE
ncbi:MAG: copper homeostasis protein CutC [Bacteroides sp.]|jgi:copper homeostasis protein|nr:copper homeostasis protein CutC [Bacteroides sp.]